MTGDVPCKGPVRLDRAKQVAQAGAERLRMEAALAAGSVPVACGADIPVAPARGPLVEFTPIRLVPGHVGLAEKTGHWARGEAERRRGARREDVFDRIEAEARKAYRARGDDAGHFVAPLTPAQIQIGRDYRDLVERHAAGGMRCASLETAGRRQGGGGGEFIDAYVAEGRRLDAMRRRVGDGAALVVRRMRPSRRGTRTTMMDRAIVDMVCLEDMDPSAILRRHGWSVQTSTLAALRVALAGALDRMMGYDLG